MLAIDANSLPMCTDRIEKTTKKKRTATTIEGEGTMGTH